MKALILIAAILGVSFATDNVKVNNQGNDGGNVHQTVNINNQDNVANINQYNGFHSWNSVWDYQRGLFAARLVSKRACVVSRMNRNVVPSLEQLSKVTQEKQNPNAPPPRSLTYTVLQTRVKNVAQYGSQIEALCKGVPTFYAQEVQGTGLFVNLHGCTDLGILRFLGISLCGNIGC
ncbi:gastrokine-1-like isoform X2 [Rana temporaria]|uniref:gastrokine-1-like isoform X2 n=1 Tax=Rana temporaria TaxID=8407 RepID=UPI001AAC7587|nr:gastrokine-1-like isoform X2 [Rana temporaria]